MGTALPAFLWAPDKPRPTSFACSFISFGLDVHLILTGDTDFTVWEEAERVGRSLLRKFFTAGSGKRWRLVIWGLCLLCC